MEHFATARYILATVGLVLLFGGAEAYAQADESAIQNTLAPRLRAVANQEASGSSRHPLLPTVDRESATGEPRYGVFIDVEDTKDLVESKFPVHVVARGLATGRLTAAQLRDVSRMDGVKYLRPSRTYEPLNDGVRARTGAHSLHVGRLNRPYSGEGVLACIIDTGIDWRHSDFRSRTDTTESRIRAIWDQTLGRQPSEVSPSPFSYGVEYKRQSIEEALDGSSTQQVRSTDDHGHGTAMASTLGGSDAGNTPRTQQGVAPNVDFVIVKTDFSGVGIADGLTYCGNTADDADRPMVAAVGAGTLAGPHDGSSPLAQSVDAFTGQGRSAVVAAGNYGDENRHVERSLSAGSTDSLQIRVPQYSSTEGPDNDIAFRLDLWTQGNRPGSMSVVTPTGRRISIESDSAGAVRTQEGTLAYERSIAPQGDDHVELVVYDASERTPPASGTWNIVTSNPSSSSKSIHGWLVETTTSSTLPNGTRRSTITIPGTAQSALTVGADIHKTTWQSTDGTDFSPTGVRSQPIAPFSSRGPLRDNARKPDIVAPGQWVASARSQSASVPERRMISEESYALFEGTSLAAAATAGGVALLFDEDPGLSGDRISDLVTGTATSESGDKKKWTPTAGHGTLDVFRAMAELSNPSIATRSLLAYDTPVSTSDQTTHTLGGGESTALSLRITPTRSGHIDGVYVRTAPGAANDLRDSLTVAVYTDEGGRPDRQLGRSVQISPRALRNHTLNFVSTAATNAVLRKGMDYHVVLRVDPDGGSLTVAGERRSVDERSLIRRGGAWKTLPADLGIRVVTSFSLTLGTPSPTAPASEAIVEAPDVPTLSWETVSEAQRYTVHVSTSPRFRPVETDTFRTRSTSISLSEVPASTGYYWRVRADRLEYTGPWSDIRSFLYYPDVVAVHVDRTFPARGDTSAPGLVALPGQQSVSLQSTMSGRPGGDWQAYWDSGSGKKGLVPFDGSSTFRFRPGSGFWLRSTDPWVVRDSVSTVPLKDDGTYQIPLHDGWNVVSNPFDQDVSWRAVERANDDQVGQLWRFTDHFERAETFASARKGEAFYVLNQQNRDVLHIPYPAHPNAPSRLSSSKKQSPALVLSATRENGPTARIQVGTRKNALQGIDPHDEAAPPSRFAALSLHTTPTSDEKTVDPRPLVGDYRTPDENGYTFPLTLRTDENDPVTIQVDSLGAFSEQQIVLVDPMSGESYDLRTTPSITIQPESDTRSFRLLVGSSDYVETKKDVELPSELQFLPNYPNPFAEQTTLEYVLPKSTPVRLTVYDVLGRQVRVLVDKKQEAGRHTVQWAGRDESGQRMASGVYLARLVVDGTTKVRKLTFVR